MVQTWIFAANTYARIAARGWQGSIGSTVPNTGRWISGREGSTPADRRLAQRLRPAGRQSGRRVEVLSIAGRARGPADDDSDFFGIAEEEPPPVDPAAVLAEFGFAAEAPLALFAGRLAEQKRVDDLLKAL